MKSINFPQANLRLLGPLGENDPNILPLPVYNDGKQSISCWELSLEEVHEIVKTHKMYFLVAAGESAPPILPLAFSPFRQSNYCEKLLWYWRENGSAGMFVYNKIDADPPEKLIWDKVTYLIARDRKPISQPEKVLEVGDFYIDYRPQGDEETPALIQKLQANHENFDFIPRNFYAQTKTKEEEIDEIFAETERRTAKHIARKVETEEILKNSSVENNPDVVSKLRELQESVKNNPSKLRVEKGGKSNEN